jgi:hypothetical protein
MIFRNHTEKSSNKTWRGPNSNLMRITGEFATENWKIISVRRPRKFQKLKTPTPGQTLLQTESHNSRLAYVEHTFSTNCTLQRASRVHQIHILKIECRLVYTKCSLFLKYDVPSTPNTYFGKRIRHLVETRMLISGKRIGNALCKMASRLHKTHIVKHRHFPPSVSSTPNAHSKNRVLSRLRQMLPISKKWRLVYTKCLLGGQRRPERSRTRLGRLVVTEGDK